LHLLTLRAFPPEAWQPTIMAHKIGRNDPCPCGSGKKTKRCHGVHDARSLAPRPPPPRFEVKPSEIAAVLDTNVLLDVFSLHDLNAQYERLGMGFDEQGQPVGAERANDRPAVYRRSRARESLLLAIHLHKIAATTYSLTEPITIIGERVDPSKQETFETHFTTHAIHFVTQRILPRWRAAMPTVHDPSLVGTKADSALLDYARVHGLPLITHEGSTEQGIADRKLRKRAQDAGVHVFVPREFYAGRLDEAAETAWFLARFRAEAPRHLDAYPRERRDLMNESLATVYSYYRHILLGESDVPERLDVTL